MSQGNIRIRPGHDTLVAITATDVRSNENEIKSLDVEKRYSTTGCRNIAMR